MMLHTLIVKIYKKTIPDKDRAYEIYINPKYEENRNKYKLRASSRTKFN